MRRRPRSTRSASTGTSKVALLLGSERGGLTTESLAAASMRVRIPMHHGVDSLNVAAAAAIARYALRRWSAADPK
ncbi:MAG: TrmH family RNA methyltransferase [Acidimicrobiia bacterium]